MPLYLRTVWPTDVCRKYYPEGLKHPTHSSNLVETKEEQTNRTLANLIRQLADLGKKSHEIFDSLESDVRKFSDRLSQLTRRVGQVEQTVHDTKGAEGTGDKVFLDYQANAESGNTWKSTFQNDAGFFTHATRPKAVKQMYSQCEAVPDLNRLQKYRDDEKTCLKMYSDPEIFFLSWKENLINEANKARDIRKAKSKSRRIKIERNCAPPSKVPSKRDEIAQREMLKGNITWAQRPKPNSAHEESKPITNDNKFCSQDSFDMDMDEDEMFPHPPADIDIPPPTEKNGDQQDGFDLNHFIPDISTPLPTPPRTPSPLQDYMNSDTRSVYLPPPPPLPPGPPPPPPPSGMNSNSMTSYKPVSLVGQLQSGVQLKSVPKIENRSSNVDDRSDLLKQIRNGKQLRKVTVDDTNSKNRNRTTDPKHTNNVAELLIIYLDNRFSRVQGSDSEDSQDEMFEDNDFN